jgi:hypothetical protein
MYVQLYDSAEGYGTLGCQVRLLCHGLLTQRRNRDLVCKGITTRRQVFVLFLYYGTKSKEAWKFHNTDVKAEDLPA